MKTTVSFIGHRTIEITPEIRQNLHRLILELIESGADTFLFGDHSDFKDLCYEIVTDLKQEHPTIRRVHYRCNYEDADEYTMRFLTAGYEESVCPQGVGKAGRAGYAERDRAMIRESNVCVFYFDENYMPPRRKFSRRDLSDYQPKSGTAAAHAYALQQGKTVYNLFVSEK